MSIINVLHQTDAPYNNFFQYFIEIKMYVATVLNKNHLSWFKHYLRFWETEYQIVSLVRLQSLIFNAQTEQQAVASCCGEMSAAASNHIFNI